MILILILILIFIIIIIIIIMIIIISISGNQSFTNHLTVRTASSLSGFKEIVGAGNKKQCLPLREFSEVLAMGISSGSWTRLNSFCFIMEVWGAPLFFTLLSGYLTYYPFIDDFPIKTSI